MPPTFRNEPFGSQTHTTAGAHTKLHLTLPNRSGREKGRYTVRIRYYYWGKRVNADLKWLHLLFPLKLTHPQGPLIDNLSLLLPNETSSFVLSAESPLASFLGTFLGDALFCEVVECMPRRFGQWIKATATGIICKGLVMNFVTSLEQLRGWN